MEQPVFPVHDGLTDPFAEWAICRPAAAHGRRIERGAHGSLGGRVLVVNDPRPRRIERAPEMSAIARPSRRLALVLSRIREKRNHDRRETVEQPPPGFRILSSLEIYLERRGLSHHLNTR